MADSSGAAEDYSGIPAENGYHQSPSRFSTHSEIPDHLRYKPYFVANQYQGTQSRFLEPRRDKAPPSSAKVYEGEKFKPIAAF